MQYKESPKLVSIGDCERQYQGLDWDLNKWEQVSLCMQIDSLFACSPLHDVLDDSDYRALNGRFINEWWSGEDMKGISLDLILGTILEFICRDQGIPWNTSVRMASFWAKTWTWDLLNMKQECYALFHNIWSSGWCSSVYINKLVTHAQ